MHLEDPIEPVIGPRTHLWRGCGWRNGPWADGRLADDWIDRGSIFQLGPNLVGVIFLAPPTHEEVEPFGELELALALEVASMGVVEGEVVGGLALDVEVALVHISVAFGAECFLAGGGGVLDVPRGTFYGAVIRSSLGAC